MIYRFYTLTLGALLSLFSFNLNAQSIGFSIDSVEIQSGQEVCVGIRTRQYLEIVTLMATLTWDSQALTLKRVTNLNLPGWSPNEFNFSTPGHLIFGWASPTGDCVSRDSGEALFEACFLAIGPNGSSTFITIDTGEAGICLGQFGTVPIGKDTGLITISTQSSTFDAVQNGIPSFQISPNPTTSSTQVVFQSPSADKSVLLVTDALARIVFEQKIMASIGENRFEIHANALKVKGMYQVSLQTKEGVSSQMLSVN